MELFPICEGLYGRAKGQRKVVPQDGCTGAEGLNAGLDLFKREDQLGTEVDSKSCSRV